MSFADATTFEHSNELVEQSYKMTYRWQSKRMQEIVQSMKNAVCRVREAEDGVDRSE